MHRYLSNGYLVNAARIQHTMSEIRISTRKVIYLHNGLESNASDVRYQNSCQIKMDVYLRALPYNRIYDTKLSAIGSDGKLTESLGSRTCQFTSPADLCRDSLAPASED